MLRDMNFEIELEIETNTENINDGILIDTNKSQSLCFVRKICGNFSDTTVDQT